MPRKQTVDARRSRADRLADLIGQLVDQGLTQREIALNLNVLPNYLSDLKHGHRDVTDVFARHFAQVYGISAGWLLTGEGNPPQLKFGGGGAARATVLLLPVLNTPHVGDPRTASTWDGSLVEVSGRAAAAAAAAKHPYVLRAADDDQRGRLHRDDLLLIDQASLESQREDVLAIVVHQRRPRLAWRGANGWTCAKSGHALGAAANCVGLCVGIIWGPL